MNYENLPQQTYSFALRSQNQTLTIKTEFHKPAYTYVFQQAT